MEADVQRTETFDDMTMNATDPSFDVFYDLERYLRETFPLFHEKLAFEKVNGHGLLFTWRGSKPDLKPVVRSTPLRESGPRLIVVAHGASRWCGVFLEDGEGADR